MSDKCCFDRLALRLKNADRYIRDMDLVIDEFNIAVSCINPLEDLRRAVAALVSERDKLREEVTELRQQKVVVPEGYALVPTYPTNPMKDAGVTAASDTRDIPCWKNGGLPGFTQIRKAYIAMVQKAVEEQKTNPNSGE